MSRKSEGSYSGVRIFNDGPRVKGEHFHYCLGGHRFNCRNYGCGVQEVGKGGLFCEKCFERKFVEIKNN